MEGTSFGDVPLNVELKLEVWDSPTRPASSSTPCGSPSSPSTMASPAPSRARAPTSDEALKQIIDDEAHDLTEAFIKKYARKTAKVAAKA